MTANVTDELGPLFVSRTPPLAIIDHDGRAS